MKSFRLFDGLLLASVFLFAGNFPCHAADPAVEDTVSIAVNDTGKLVLLGISGANRVKFGVNTSFGALDPGMQAVLGSSNYKATASGGYLKYTLYDQPTSKITVQTTTADYNDSAVAVMIYSLISGGSAAIGTGSALYVPIKKNAPQDLVTGIPGAYTWTGTLSNNGARVRYNLRANPFLGSGSVDETKTITIVYTITQQ